MDPHAPLVGGFNAIQIGSIAAGAIVVLVLIRVLKNAISKETPGKYEARMRCGACGWTGVVPRLKPACRKCGNTSLAPVR